MSVCAPVRANAFVETMRAQRYVPIEAMTQAVCGDETAAALWAASLAVARQAEIGVHEIAVRAVLVRGGLP
jgi:hypothetical protein